MTYDLSTRAMLVSLRITQWTCSKVDKDATSDVQMKAQATREAGQFNKRLLSKGSIGPVKEIIGKIRNRHYELTLPWSNEGARILSAAMFAQYDKEMRDLKGDLDFALADFFRDYHSLIGEARNYLGGLFNASDYPTLKVIQAKYTYDLSYTPLPSGSDFRVKLSDDLSASIKRDIEARTRASVDASMTEVYDRVAKIVGHMAESLEEYSVVQDAGKTKVLHPFRDTLVANVRNLADLLPGLNVTGNAKLAQVTVSIKAALLGAEPDELRADPTLRKQVATDARAILDDMAGLMGRD